MAVAFQFKPKKTKAFDFDATMEALAVLWPRRLQLFTDASAGSYAGWCIVCHIVSRFEQEVEHYTTGRA
jgi:hypothetical protein